MAAKFNVGDVVVLKSGGPKMTVETDFLDGTVRTVWFAGAKQEDAILRYEVLQLASDDTKK
ncbi:YodC family protein [Bradyrhizobium sp. USDA 329]|uniref:YodC family protein n=1 Tax=unclassified Bradyrhizobium TaxID=2631580 RepID=UPI003511107F